MELDRLFKPSYLCCFIDIFQDILDASKKQKTLVGLDDNVYNEI